MNPVRSWFKNCTSLFISGLRQNPLISKIDQINNYISVWTVTREKQLPNWSKNASEIWRKFNRNTMYIVASVPRFHAGFGKSDLTRVFWESRDSTNSTRSRITAADMRKREARKTVFSVTEIRDIGNILLFIGGWIFLYNRVAWKRCISCVLIA